MYKWSPRDSERLLGQIHVRLINLTRPMVKLVSSQSLARQSWSGSKKSSMEGVFFNKSCCEISAKSLRGFATEAHFVCVQMMPLSERCTWRPNLATREAFRCGSAVNLKITALITLSFISVFILYYVNGGVNNLHLNLNEGINNTFEKHKNIFTVTSKHGVCINESQNQMIK